MRRFHYLFLLFILSLATPSSPWAAKTKVDASKAENVVKAFVEGEFHAVDHTRRTFGKFTPESVEANREECDCECTDLERSCKILRIQVVYNWDALIIVTNFKIESVTVNGNQATARVDYRRIASTKGLYFDRELVADLKDHDPVLLNLIRENDEWFILDPPASRVSPEAFFEKIDYFLSLNRVDQKTIASGMTGDHSLDNAIRDLRLIEEIQNKMNDKPK